VSTARALAPLTPTAVYNVRAAPYNATGNGNSDDTPAISAAASAALVTGGVVYFPAGIYGYTSLPAHFGITYRGEHETASILKPLIDTHGVTLEDYNIGLGAINFEYLGFNGINTTGKACFKNAGTLDRTQQSYGLNVERCIIQNFNVGAALRSWRNVRILNNWFQNVTTGIDITGFLLDIFINNNYIVYASGAGAGTSAGIVVNSFNFTGSGGVSRPETVYIFDNEIFGFSVGLSLLSGLNVRAILNDIEALQIGIEITSVEAGLAIKDNYIEVDGAAAINGIMAHGLGGALTEGKINIEGNTVIGTATVAASGIEINDAGNQNQDHVRIIGNIVNGWTKADIRVNNGNDVRIEGNNCVTAAPAQANIYLVCGVGPSQIVVDDNTVATSIAASNTALISSGLIDLGINTINGVRTGGRDTWITPTFSAGDYTASGSMTWRVIAGNVTTMAYALHNRRLTVSFVVNGPTVGAPLSNELRVKIPGGFTATKTMYGSCLINDNGSFAIGISHVSAGGRVIAFGKAGGANFAASTRNTGFFGTISFEINP
jgi:hypothetical protein